ncbi:hypothetical protein GJ688_11905 [Heliobacillus mobilis]|uniref:Methyltransferase domain-containing protein n=1 Tax=Heliobacterium mobile TaxID=28064 RepID=A0A6I3SL84_HELMO|nr:hypothetical protein [Heliobacterium mobile]MTV49679.1 hypothetical protein [Heliobacterium mobile]
MREDYTYERSVTAKDFADIFGTTEEDINAKCGEMLQRDNFQYDTVEGKERDQIIVSVLKELEGKPFSVSGQERQIQWEKGWRENLDVFLRSGDIRDLTPKYINKHPIKRLKQNYIRPKSENYELNYFNLFKTWLFKTYFHNASSIYEFGFGPGHNLATLADMYPQARLTGFDWAKSSIEILDAISPMYGDRIAGKLFNMFSPDFEVEVDKQSAFLTIGSLEQLGDSFEKILDFFIRKKPSICVNVEPIIELYDPEHLLDWLAIKYHQKRGYLNNYLTRLRELESQGVIEICETRRIHFSNQYHEGSLIVWRPIG